MRFLLIAPVVQIHIGLTQLAFWGGCGARRPPRSFFSAHPWRQGRHGWAEKRVLLEGFALQTSQLRNSYVYCKLTFANGSICSLQFAICRHSFASLAHAWPILNTPPCRHDLARGGPLADIL